MFEYLRRVKIPALMQQSVFLDAYAADMQVDLERLAELETDGSGVIDTDELANRIVSLQRVNDELSRWISSNGEQNPDACNYAIQVMQGNQDSVARFQQQLDKALAHASDSSIYSSSSTEMDVLGEASAAMQAVCYSPASGTYDLSGADLSWVTLDLVGKYADAAQRLGAVASSGGLMAAVVMALMGEGGDCCAYGGDPVNLATGNFIYAYDYLAFDSRPRMSLCLFYNSHGRGTSPLGMGWTHPFAVSLAVELNRAVVSMEDGHAEIFLGTPERGFAYLLGRADALSCEDDGYVYVSAAGIRTESDIATSFSYDSGGHLASVTNARGITELRNTFDERGRVTRQEFADGGVISYAYDDGLMQVVVTDQLGNESTYVHDGLFRTVEVRTGDAVERTSYNEKNLKTRVVNPRGLTSSYQFDAVGNLVCVSNPVGERTTYEYNVLNKPVRAAVNGTTVFRNEYDDLGRITKTIDAVGNETRFLHDESGDLLSVTRADGSVTLFEHDALGLVTAATGPQGATERREFDECGMLAAWVDANGNRTSYEHDSLGNVTAMTNAEGNRRTYEYDGTGLLVRMVDYDGVPVSYEYDCMGRPVRFVDKDGNESRREYDLAGRLVKDVDATGAATMFEYDAAGNVTKATDALGASTSFRYDLNGNRTRVLLPDGTILRATYDQLDRMRSVRDGAGSVTYYQYDAMGNLVHEVDPMENHLWWGYDAACRLTSSTDAMGRTTGYELRRSVPSPV